MKDLIDDVIDRDGMANRRSPFDFIRLFRSGTIVRERTPHLPDIPPTGMYGVEVHLDGKDVTSDCFAYDCDANQVWLLRRRDGRLYIEGDDVAWEMKTGEVSLVAKGGGVKSL